MKIQTPKIFEPLWRTNARYKVSYGGRGGGRSWAFAHFLIAKSLQSRVRILCAREHQTSIRDSVHRLLADQIRLLNLDSLFTITREAIVSANGSNFLFKGLHHNITDIKSLEGVDVVWIEEAEKVTEESWNILIPTIRKPSSEILVTFNPYKETDPTYQRFIVNTPDNCVLMKASWKDNPHFPEVLRLEMEHDRETNYDRYRWIWEGEPLGLSDAQVFKDKYELADFEHEGERLYFGADWGFAKDPSTLVRCFIRDKCLYIEHEAYGVGVDIDQTPELFRSVPGAESWIIYADSARPETISYMKRNGFPKMRSVKKWAGSVEDGITFMRSFKKIYIHSRCRHTLQEFELYRYKTDKLTGEVLPIIVDADNHILDACRYALSDLIQQKGVTIGSKRLAGL